MERNTTMSTIRIELLIDVDDAKGKDIVIRISGKDLRTCLEQKAHAGKKPTGMGLLLFFKEHIRQSVDTRSARTIECYRHVYSRLSRYLDEKGMSEVAVDEVTAQFVAQYEQYLKRCELTLNTISFHLRILRTVYNKAVEQGLCADQRPFRQAYTKVAKTAKRALSIASIRAIRQYQAKNRMVSFAQDMFMFSFYTHGMSFVDMAYLRESNVSDGYLNYQRHKTGQTIRLRWEPCMQEIVDKYHVEGQQYLLPIIHSRNGKERNQYRSKQYIVNKSLREITSDIRLERKLTMYVARHSWASIAEQQGLPVNLISQGLGHASEKTTQIYLKTIRLEQIDQANTDIIKLMTEGK